MIDDAPLPVPQIIIVEDAVSHAPTMFLGFMAVGDEPAMQALEGASSAAQFPHERTKNRLDQTEVMILFPAGSDQRRAKALFQDAVSGKFGKLAVEVTVAPVAALADGKLDFDKEVSAQPPSSIIVQQR
jgi:hypothetical protein